MAAYQPYFYTTAAQQPFYTEPSAVPAGAGSAPQFIPEVAPIEQYVPYEWETPVAPSAPPVPTVPTKPATTVPTVKPAEKAVTLAVSKPAAPAPVTVTPY